MRMTIKSTLVSFLLYGIIQSGLFGMPNGSSESPWNWQRPATLPKDLAWARDTIEGFAWPASIKPGETLNLYVSVVQLAPLASVGQNYDIRIYRIAGTDVLVRDSLNIQGQFFPLHDSADQAILPGHKDRRPVEFKRGCLRYWQGGRVSFSTAGWQTGVYYAQLKHTTSPNKINYAPFVIRSLSPGSTTKNLFKYDINTFQAYNYWGGGSLYSISQDTSLAWTDTIAMDRPLPSAQSVVHTYFMQSFVKVLSDSGYALDYCNNIDLDSLGLTGSGMGMDLLKNYTMLVIWNHDEYWATGERDNIEQFKGSTYHGNIARFAPNTCFWRINWLIPSGHRLLYCRKGDFPPWDSTYDKWRFTAAHGGPGRPEAVLLGSQYERGFNLEEPPDIVRKPEHWIFKNTGLQKDSLFGYGVLKDGVRHGIVSGETDNTLTGQAPFPLDTLAQRLVWSSVECPQCSTYLQHQMIYYEDTTSNARVFAQGSGNWWLGLSSEASDTADVAKMRKITTNIISHFAGKRYIGNVYTDINFPLTVYSDRDCPGFSWQFEGDASPGNVS